MSFLNKVGGDLSSCRFNWEILHYLLRLPSAQIFTVNLKKNSFLEKRVTQLLPFLYRMELQRWRFSNKVCLIFHQQHLVPGTKQSVAVNPPSAFRPSPSFVRTSIREISRAHSSHMTPWLLRSLDHVINLSCTELDSEDCAALLFILRHSDGVKLKLMWSSIPAEGIQSILCLLHTVSDLRSDIRAGSSGPLPIIHQFLLFINWLVLFHLCFPPVWTGISC